MSQLEHAYLRSAVGAPLTEAMAQLAISQPDDPIEFLGNFLLQYVANERRKLDAAPASTAPMPNAEPVEMAMPTMEEQTAARHAQQAQSLQTALEPAATPRELQQRFLRWLAELMHAEEAYLGRKTTLPTTGAAIVHWLASSRSPVSHVVNRTVDEASGVTMDAFKPVEDADPNASPMDADGNPVPPSVPPYLHIQNVLREPRMQFYHVPKLGAFLVRGVAYKRYLHAQVFNEANASEPMTLPEWLAIACDTMGQARAFTDTEIDDFQHATTQFAQALEQLEAQLYAKDAARKTSGEDAQLREFGVAWLAQIAAQEESMQQQLPPAISDDDKPQLEAQARLAFLTKMLLEHLAILATSATRVVPLPDVAVVAIALALVLLGHDKRTLWNSVTQAPEWSSVAPWLEEEPLREAVTRFKPDFELLPIAETQLAMSAIAKADVEAASPIAASLWTWTQAVIACAEQEQAAQARARAQAAAQEEAAAEATEAT